MSNTRLIDMLTHYTGSRENAKKVLKEIENTRSDERLYLTDAQRRVYDYLLSGKPITSQAQLARDCGFDHPQKLLSPVAALLLKGLLVVK